MTPIDIRRASINDLDELTPLFTDYRVFYRQERDANADREFLQQRLEQNESVIFMALQENKAVGFTQLYPTFSSVTLKHEWILNDLFVDPETRGEGIGAALLNAAREFGRRDGARCLMLETQADNPARYLYEKLGWKLDSHLHYTIDC